MQELLPQTVADTTHYNLRNRPNYHLPNYRLQSTNNSFIPFTCNLWNDLPLEIRNAPTLQNFKTHLKTQKSKDNTIYFNTGHRKANILHCRLRNRASTLNYDLFYANIILDSSCDCGHPCEDCNHFFLHCPLFHNQRLVLIRDLIQYGYPTLQFLLHGDINLNYNNNTTIAQAVQTFILTSRRFEN